MILFFNNFVNVFFQKNDNTFFLLKHKVQSFFRLHLIPKGSDNEKNKTAQRSCFDPRKAHLIFKMTFYSQA